jgi:Tol biopolymer transport system component
MRIGVGLAVTCAAFIPAALANGAKDIVYSCSSDLCLIDPDAAAPSPTNLTQTDSASERSPAWSPDGSAIAYAGSYPGDTNGYDIYTTDATPLGDATNVSQTTDRAEEFTEPPRWSPDGASLAYGATYNSNPGLASDVFVSPATGTTDPLAIGSSPAGERSPTWSPDGTRIAFSRGTGVFIGRPDGGDTPALLPNSQNGLQPAWSPDGTRIAMLREVGSTRNIRVVRVDGTGTPVDLSAPASSGAGPVWSPDSTHLAWGGPDAIHVAPANGSSVGVDIPEATGGTHTAYHPTFSPDGTRVAFDAADDTFFGRFIFVAPADGSDPAEPITAGGQNDQEPDWKPGEGSPPPPPPPPGDRPAAKINLAAFGSHGPINPFRLRVSIACHVDGYTSNDPACHGNGVAKGTPGKSHLLVNKGKKKKVFAKGSTTIPAGKTGKLKLKVTKSGRKLLKHGRKLKVAVQITVSSPGSKTVTAKKKIKIKIPHKR